MDMAEFLLGLPLGLACFLAIIPNKREPDAFDVIRVVARLFVLVGLLLLLQGMASDIVALKAARECVCATEASPSK